jgi:hypothetical protein
MPAVASAFRLSDTLGPDAYERLTKIWTFAQTVDSQKTAVALRPPVRAFVGVTKTRRKAGFRSFKQPYHMSGT